MLTLYDVVNSGSTFSIVVKGNIKEKFSFDKIIFIFANIINIQI